MLTLKLKALELVRDHDVYSAYSFRFSEYGSSVKAKEPGRHKIELDDVVDISFDQESPDPLLVVSLLGTRPDGSREIICVTYLSVVALIKQPEHSVEFVEGLKQYILTLRVAADERLKNHNFNLLAPGPTAAFGQDFGLTHFSSITLEFVRCVTPMRRAWEEIVLLLSWTSPLTTLVYLCAASFVIYFGQWIMLLLGVILWSPLKKVVIGCLVTVEMPNTDDYVVEDFKKNLGFIQMIEASYVDLVKASRGVFEGVNRNRLNRAVEFLKVLPLFGLLTWLYVPTAAKICAMVAVWLGAFACHPLGVQIAQTLLVRLNILTYVRSEPASVTAKIVNSVTQKVTAMTAQPSPGNQLIRDVVLYENQRWWLGVGFTPKFIMDGRNE